MDPTIENLQDQGLPRPEEIAQEDQLQLQLQLQQQQQVRIKNLAPGLLVVWKVFPESMRACRIVS
jgi:hypothetical protein